MSGVEHLTRARPQAMSGQDILRRPRGHAGKARLAAGQPHPWRLREPERVIAVHEHSEHLRSANDRNRAGANAGAIARSLEASPRPDSTAVAFGFDGSGAIALIVRVSTSRLRRGEFG